jgi:hypothetical protein
MLLFLFKRENSPLKYQPETDKIANKIKLF